MKDLRKAMLLAALCACHGVYAQDEKVYVVSNAHFDSQWNWDVQKSIRDYVSKTLDSNLTLFEHYPNYLFNFEGGIKYSWMKEYYPLQYEQVKRYIREGRWHVTGSTWDANDANIPSTESFARNILYGQQFYQREFGVQGTDIFLPDCFGFGYTLPSIAAHFGLIGFSTQKLQWRAKPFFEGGKKIPFEIGLWQGVDGKRIMLVADAHGYTTSWPDTDLTHLERLQKMTAASPLKTVYHYYGTGDSGGSPTLESVRAMEKTAKGTGPLTVINATSDQLYKDYLPYDSHPELPVYEGELLMDLHGTGCYTSQAAMKLFNRRNELLSTAAERAAVMADWAGAMDYSTDWFATAHKRYIWHQFHDDLTGTSIPRAYEFSWNDELISLKQFGTTLEAAVGAVSAGMDTQVKGTPIIVYNPTSYAASQSVEMEVPTARLTGKKAGSVASVTAYGPKGQQVRCQVLSSTATTTRLLLEADVPAVGYAVYDLRATAGRPATVSTAAPTTLENSIYRLTLNAEGDIASIIDKRSGRELVAEGKAIRLALFEGNESKSWPAWEIMKSTLDQTPVSISGNVRITMAEDGPLRKSVLVERTYDTSTFRQLIRLHEGALADRIDLVNDIDWDTTDALLKAEFPLSVSNDKATYDLGLGNISRGNNQENAYEVYAHQWTDLTDRSGDYGVSVLNDCKYGWDKPADNVIRLTLLHTPSTGTGYSYQSRQDFGHHHFTYSIVGHAGNLHEAGIVAKAEQLNQPLVAFAAPKHKGSMGRSFSMIDVDNSAVILKTLKHAEEGDEYVARFYETTGKASQHVNCTLPAELLSAIEVNGMEEPLAQADGHLSVCGRTLSFDIAPFGIKTFRFRLQPKAAALPQQQNTPIALPYNCMTASYNGFRRFTNYDGRGNSFAAELLPEALDVNGIHYDLAPADTLNAVKCRGQQLEIPAGTQRIHLLLASITHDQMVTFTMGDRTTNIVAPYYTGFVGQWGHTGHTEGFLKTADIAYCGTHLHSMNDNADMPYEFTYMFDVALDVPAGARTLTLPINDRVTIFAATAVSGDHRQRLAPVTPVLGVNLPAPYVDPQPVVKANLTAGKRVTKSSGDVRWEERAQMAIDDNVTTKWCDLGGGKEKFMEVDLGEETELQGWYVMHAGMESTHWISKEYDLQYKLNKDDEWQLADRVTDNVAQETDRRFAAPIRARFLRLTVTKPDQDEGSTVRIYEFYAY